MGIRVLHSAPGRLVAALAMVLGLARAQGATAAPSSTTGAAVASLAAIEGRSGPIPDGASFELYRWNRFPAVLIFDFADFPSQDRMFSRLAFFLEKRGFRGRLLGDAELSGKHGWNAHDYGPEGLAAFFSAADAAGFRLDRAEEQLRRIALDEGIIEGTRGSYEPGSGAVLSISRASSRYERILLLAHESYHGIFFTSEEYRALCVQTWTDATPHERNFILRLLDRLGYDSSDRTLAINEFQAYLLQQPRANLAAYFERVSTMISDESGAPRVSDVLPSLMADELRLESFLTERYGIGAGGVEIASGPAQ